MSNAEYCEEVDSLVIGSANDFIRKGIGFLNDEDVLHEVMFAIEACLNGKAFDSIRDVEGEAE